MGKDNKKTSTNTFSCGEHVAGLKEKGILLCWIQQDGSTRLLSSGKPPNNLLVASSDSWAILAQFSFPACPSFQLNIL